MRQKPYSSIDYLKEQVNNLERNKPEDWEKEVDYLQ